MYNPNVLLINKENIKFNLDNIKRNLGEKTNIMPIVKANAYGIGIDYILDIIREKNITQIGVATVEEAVYIRKKYEGMILVLLQPFKEHIEDILINDIVTNVSDFNFLVELNKIAQNRGITAKVHIEINTGMGRTGIQLNEITEFVCKIKELSYIKVEGISSHFSTTKDKYYTKEQINKFNYAINIIQKYINSIKYIHICSSSSILNYPEAHFNLVRIGIMMYGYYNDKRIKLIPSLKLLTHISYIHNVRKGDAIGYNKVTIAKKDMKVAIIPIGFADAFMGLESDIAYVLINNQKANIIAICMDSMIIDITDIKQVATNTEVVLWDNKNITLEQWGEWTKTSTYEVLSILSNRIKRKMI